MQLVDHSNTPGMRWAQRPCSGLLPRHLSWRPRDHQHAASPTGHEPGGSTSLLDGVTVRDGAQYIDGHYY